MKVSEEKFIEVDAYSKLAQVYDDLMYHVDYVKWIDYIDEILFSYKRDFCKLIDIACGTGTMAILFQQRGYNTTGSDGCAGMIEQAQEKSIYHEIPLPFYTMNMTEISLEEKFDAVICLYDSINYVLKREGVEKTLQNAWNLLNEGGIFVFDICTEENSIRFFDGYEDKGETRDYKYIRHSKYNSKDKIQFNTFYLFSKDGTEYFKEVHHQKIYTIGEMMELVDKSLFTFKGKYHDFSFEPPNLYSERIHFVLQKVQNM